MLLIHSCEQPDVPFEHSSISEKKVNAANLADKIKLTKDNNKRRNKRI